MRKKKRGFSIRKKMLCSYLTIVAFILVVGFLGIFNTQRVYRNGNKIYVNNLQSVEALKSIHQNVKEIDQCVISMMGPLAADYYDTYRDKITLLQQENQELMESYSEIRVSELEKRRYEQCRLSILTFNKQIDNIILLLDEMQSVEVETSSGKMRKVSGDLVSQKQLAVSTYEQQVVTTYEQELMPAKACTYELIEAIVELATENARLRNEENHQVYNNLVWIIGVVMLLSVIIAVVITLKMSGSFNRRLGQIQELALRISEYNISDDIEYTGNDEFGETMAALNESQFMLRDLLEKITDESATIGDIGSEVSEAVRKSGQKIEAVNVDLYNVEDAIEELEQYAKKSMDREDAAPDTMRVLQQISQKCQSSKDWMQEMQTALTGIATYLEQIGITAEYQNEIANNHRAQVERFRVSGEDQTQKEAEEGI